jgi:hypothetical protein
VVAGNDNDGHCRARLPRGQEGLREASLCYGGGGGTIKHIARKHKSIRFRSTDNVHNRSKGRLELLVALVLIELVTEMPVTCMENLHITNTLLRYLLFINHDYFKAKMNQRLIVQRYDFFFKRRIMATPTMRPMPMPTTATT